MKQYKIITAYNIIEEMRKKKIEYPSTVSYALFRVKKALQDQYEFQSEEERKILEELKPDVNGPGQFDFHNNENAQRFLDRLEELRQLDVDLDYTKPTIKLTDNLPMTIEEAEALDDFINFEE